MAYYHYKKKKNKNNNGLFAILLIIILFLIIQYIEVIKIIFITLFVIGMMSILIYFVFYKKVNNYAEKKRQELKEAKIRLSKYFDEKKENQLDTINNCQENLHVNQNIQNMEREFFNYQKKTYKPNLSYWEKKVKGDNYEKQVGSYFENQGYSVEYRGLIYGKKDGGIDLIAKKEKETLLIQCKAWDNTIIKQRHVIKFLGDCSIYLQDYPQEAKTVLPIFVTTSEKSDYGLNQFLRYNSTKIKYIIMPLN